MGFPNPPGFSGMKSGPAVRKIKKDMGNKESTYYDSNEDFQQQHSKYAENPIESNYQQRNLPEHYSSYQQRTLPGQYSYAESSIGSNYQQRKQPSYIADNYSSLDEVIAALREAGLESSNLILGIDFTKSNEWTGRHSYNRKSLHAIGDTPNPYEQSISIICRTLSSFDEDSLIPCFGFGDVSTRDHSVFSFYPEDRYCKGFEEALARYREITPYIKLSGPTSFAPLIDAAIDIVERNNKQYHILVIIADGQVSRNPDVPPGKYSPQEQATIKSIVDASQYPLSIILVGMGDGPWDAMQHFDDHIPQRTFDNFQFVNFTKIMSENTETSNREAAFALAALMEIPLQYRATLSLELYDRDIVSTRRKRPLPPPCEVLRHDDAIKPIQFQHTSKLKSDEHRAPEESLCPICLTNSKNMAFGCGHTTCEDCSRTISSCPLCRKPIVTRLKLYT